ncbi:MAG: response regulator [Ignavibacteria bacterium]
MNHDPLLLFQHEWEKIFKLFLNENSLDALTAEVLSQELMLTHSSLGIIIFLHESVKEQIDYRILDQEGTVTDADFVIAEIKNNLIYIAQWLKLNKKSLVINEDDTKVIGHGLTVLLNKKRLLLTPSFIEDELLSVTILAKSSEVYLPSEISSIEHFSSIFAVSANNIVTRNLNNALQDKLMQSQKLETIGKLASGMAHDFNNLLSSIFASLNLLKKKLSDKSEVQYLIDNIESCSVRAAELTRGLLSYGKTTKKKILIKPLDLIKELLNAVVQTFPDKIKIEHNFASELPDILGNATEIYQVLLNLCINAKEAIKEEGTITLSSYNFTINEKNLFDYPLLNKGNYVCFSIKDTGDGIDENNMTKIFDPYFSTKRKETVSGLGLYVTYGIVKAHNGHIDIKSKKGQGTEFIVYIPSSKKTSAGDTEVKTEKIILLADDEIMLRNLLAELLESYDFDVITVQNGAEALKVLTEEIKVDLLIIDYKMPEMDGLTFINKLKELNIHIPVILSTGSTSAAVDKAINDSQIDLVLTKPYEFEKMLEAVQKLI